MCPSRHPGLIPRQVRNLRPAPRRSLRDSCRAELPPASRRERDGPPVRDRCGRCAANDGQGRHNSFPGGRNGEARSPWPHAASPRGSLTQRMAHDGAAWRQDTYRPRRAHEKHRRQVGHRPAVRPPMTATELAVRRPAPPCATLVCPVRRRPRRQRATGPAGEGRREWGPVRALPHRGSCPGD